ncbi:DNA polymerase III subunit epsilon [Flavobacterium akiainvivens]|uniref:DNA polymerase III subunit epsilon n=1 Tax=Flavobacterium akiainvivens TaxID=1202724 RepID=A0A0M9VJM1_9FLAO|nr:3'-5' exonuclease [Flavobacterium akiainvivens]KOS07886.1 DNA polymerase III subunit epsilon [Flavobacterium akiainvivens]SFQ28132.1 DNA polymerase-3 subunit epsilon [Flavobacterium akiainvivens]
MTFTAIDFETATGHAHSACAVGIVTVEDGLITEEYHTLIQPPDNEYWYRNIMVHGIKPADTLEVPTFDVLFPEIQKRLFGRKIVAHNESFDRNVLAKTMRWYGLYYDELELADRWECTVKIYRAKGYPKANLKYCSDRNGIALNHHEALSDARACAKLYLLSDGQLRLKV